MSHPQIDNGYAVGSQVSPGIFAIRAMEKIRANVKRDHNGCWIWQKFTHPKGYGEICIGAKKWRAHRLVLIITQRPLRDDELACHRCNVKSCCNPEHLYIGSKQSNAIDKVESGTNYYRSKTHCPHGHSYAVYGQIARGRRNGRPWRTCGECSRLRWKKAKQSPPPSEGPK